MKLNRFIKEEKLGIIFNVIVFLCVNIYFITLNYLKDKKGDLIYLDMVLLVIYLIWFFVKYKRWKERYDELYSYVTHDEDIDRYAIKFI